MIRPKSWHVAGIVLLAVAPVHAASQRRVGDVLAYALPIGTLGFEFARGEYQGAWQFTESFGVAAAATEGLARVTHVERPDHSNFRSFPSGHATAAFAPATYVHRRYGFAYAWPLYAAAVYVGHTRVAAHRHRWADVAGSAAVSGAASWWLVDPAPNRRIALVPDIGRRHVGVQFFATW